MKYCLENEYHMSFSQIAKESGFRFNLYKGRVDWKKLDVLDVDRIVRDLDMEMLNIHANNVINCNLNAEYDVKILDSNFVKLFQIAQLTIDFLLHCKHYLETELRESYLTSQTVKQEVTTLKKQLYESKLEVRKIKKKWKENVEKEKLLLSPRLKLINVQCSVCKKIFLNQTFLDAHQARRHTEHNMDDNKIIPLKEEIEVLKERLQSTQYNISRENNEKKETEMQVTNKGTEPAGINYQDEIRGLKEMFYSELQKLKDSKTIDFVQEKLTENDSLEKVNSHPKDIVTLSQLELQNYVKNDSYWEEKFEAREAVWKARLSALDQAHKKEMRNIEEKFKCSYKEGESLKIILDKRLQKSTKINDFESKEIKPMDSNVSGETSGENINPDEHIEKSKNTKELDNERLKPVENVEISVQIKDKDSDRKVLSDILTPIPTQMRTKRTLLVHQKTFSEPVNQNCIVNFSINKNDIVQDMTLLQDTKSYFDNNQANNNTVEKNEPEIIRFDHTNSKISTTNNVTENLIEGSVDSTICINNKQNSTSNKFIESPSIYSANSTNSIYNSESDSETTQGESERHFLEDKNELQKNVGLQSIQSMEEILASNPEILTELRYDLTSLLERRLKELGIDSKWLGIPKKTYQMKMAVLKHHQNITAKRFIGYSTLRDMLIQTLNDHCLNKSDKVETNLKEYKRSRLSSKTGEKWSQRGLSTRFTLCDSRKPFNKEFYVESNSLKHCPLIPESKPQDSVIIPKYGYGNVGERTLKELSQFENEDLSDLKEEIINFKNSTIDMDVSLVRTRSEFILSSSDKEEDANSPLSRNHSQQICKSALRSSSSTGNLTKKKVVFLDELFSGDKRSFSDDKLNFSSSDCVTPKNSATSLDKINFNHNLHEEPQNSVNLNSTFTLQLPKLPSPASSLTSIGSSLLDISPTIDKNIKANASDKFNLELSLVDIEENLRSD